MTSPLRTSLLVLGGLAACIAAASLALVALTAPPGGTIHVLLGTSRSEHESSERITSCARAAADRALEDGATLILSPISSTPVSMQSTGIDTALSLKERTNHALADRRHARLRRQADNQIDAILRGKSPPGASDVLSATLASAAILEPAPGPKTLVICGDAHQASPELNVLRRRPSPSHCTEDLRKVAPLPDLSSVTVVFGAATLDTQSQLPADHERAIADWWKTCWAPAVRAHIRYGSTPQL
jgi:hypothetical protein